MSNYTTTEQRQEIRRVWALYGRPVAVAQATGVDRKTASRHRPGREAPQRLQGYSTWSEAARRRWDTFWAQPFCVERLEAMLQQGKGKENDKLA